MATLELKLSDDTIVMLRATDSRTEGYRTAAIWQRLRRQNSGIRWENRPDVYSGVLGSSQHKPATKVIFKIASDIDTVGTLEREYRFYSQQLVHLQGTVIPRCYGLYRAFVYDNPFGCLILEMCEETPLRIGQDTRDDNDEFIRKFMVGLCKIHQAGVVHNGLASTSHIVRHGREPRIIDFSNSTRHTCSGAAPAVLQSGNKVDATVRYRACSELVVLEETIGISAGFLRPTDLISSIAHGFSTLYNRAWMTLGR